MTHSGRSIIWYINPSSWFYTDLVTLLSLVTVYSVWNAVFVALDFFEATRANGLMIQVMLYVLAGIGVVSILTAMTAKNLVMTGYAVPVSSSHSMPSSSYLATICIYFSALFLFVRECWYVFEIIWIATHWDLEELNDNGHGNGGYHIYAPCIFMTFRFPVFIIYALFAHRLIRRNQSALPTTVIEKQPPDVQIEHGNPTIVQVAA